MALSINTNSQADTALRINSIVQRDLEETNNRISTGSKVKESKDDAASFQIAMRMAADLGVIGAGIETQGFAQASTNVAAAAGEMVSEQLMDLKAQAVRLQSGGLDAQSRSTIEQQMADTVAQIGGLVDSAEFNGVNLLESGTSISAASGADGDQVVIDGQGMSLADLGIDNLDFSNPGSVLTAIDGAIEDSSGKLAAIGAAQNQLEGLEDFSSKLKDAVSAGIGKMIDADLGAESARLAAGQASSQLSGVSMGIANSAGRAIAGLF